MASDSLDTCLIISAVLGEPVEQRDAVWSLLESGDMHHVSDLAISETVYVLEYHYRQTRAEIVFGLESFFKTHDDVLSYNKDLFALVFPYYAAHPALSFNDCCLAYYAEAGHAEPLFTFDQKLAKTHPSTKML